MSTARHVKTPLLTCLLAFGWHAALTAQQLKAPDSLQATKPMGEAAPAKTPSTTEVERLAEEAQKALFQSVDKAGGGAAAGKGAMDRASSNPYPSSSSPVRRSAQHTDNPSQWAKGSVHKLAVMEVAFGAARETVMIELYPNDAPQTVNNFIDHCDSGFYNGLAFHRAIEGFLVQTGDPLTSDESARTKWGTGGEDKTVPAEIKLPHRVGSVAMARRSDKVNPERRSNGSQFYIALGNFASIDGRYTVFGQVVSGLETIKRISIMPVDANDCPVARIEIKSVKVIDQTGPLQLPAMSAGEGLRYIKPDAARSMLSRFFRHVW